MNGKSLVSVGMDSKHLELLMALSDIDNITLADEIRTAIDEYISFRVSDRSKISARIAEIKRNRDLRLNKLLELSDRL